MMNYKMKLIEKIIVGFRNDIKKQWYIDKLMLLNIVFDYFLVEINFLYLI